MRFIRLNENDIIVSIRIGERIVDGEIESETGECGQIRQSDGTFIWPEVPVITHPTLDEIKENQLILMEALAVIFETITTV